MDMLLEFPNMVLQNKEGTRYDGYITVMNEDFRLCLEYPSDIAKATLSCDWKLKCLLDSCLDVLKQRILQSKSLPSFLQEMTRIIEKKLEVTKSTKSSKEPIKCGQIISEIESLGWDRLVSVDADFTLLQFLHTDHKGREHILGMKLHPQHPVEPPQCITDLPVPFDPHWTNKSTLEDLYNQFTHSVNSYQLFWDCMEDIDKNTWVLEPDNPSFSAVYRRIAISSSASVQITVDPRQPQLLPSCRFMGADHSVSQLRQNMNSNLYHWDPEGNLLENLQSLLDIIFPTPTTSKKEEFSMECGICYSYKLETELPNEVCNDSRCEQAYHHSCLYEWLRSSGCRQSFNTVFGECPYCSKPITVKMPTT
ncbi:E3 ubiquitin-protein ligase FANCL-like [Mytilus trossulus]|uniref:E3 ubiquitin-protein ligase FANCL-like n=1 Tax=Mytilus trossulus TaxID=6551 RepID=UPI0030043315